MKSLLSYCLIIFIFSTTSFASAASDDRKCPQQTMQSRTSWLHTVSAGTAQLSQPLHTGYYVLSMTLPKANQITTFTDRPNRRIEVMTGKQLAKHWNEGSNSFSNDPPNAVLSAANLRPVFITLTHVKINRDHIAFRLKPISKQAKKPAVTGTLRHITLTVDNSSYDTYPAGGSSGCLFAGSTCSSTTGLCTGTTSTCCSKGDHYCPKRNICAGGPRSCDINPDK